MCRVVGCVTDGYVECHAVAGRKRRYGFGDYVMTGAVGHEVDCSGVSHPAGGFDDGMASETARGDGVTNWAAHREVDCCNARRPVVG